MEADERKRRDGSHRGPQTYEGHRKSPGALGHPFFRPTFHEHEDRIDERLGVKSSQEVPGCPGPAPAAEPISLDLGDQP